MRHQNQRRMKTLPVPAPIAIQTTEDMSAITFLGEQIATRYPVVQDWGAGPPSQDNRSYRVSFDKIATRLPGYKTRWTALQGAHEMRRLFERIEHEREVDRAGRVAVDDEQRRTLFGPCCRAVDDEDIAQRIDRHAPGS